MDVLEELVRLRRSGERCALATIVEVNGSIPSFESAKMLVRADGTIVGLAARRDLLRVRAGVLLQEQEREALIRLRPSRSAARRAG